MKLKLALVGSRSHRTPMAYAPYRALFERHVSFVAPIEADILVFSMPFEIPKFFQAQPDLLASLKPFSVWLISEEPLWDTVWNRDHRLDASYVQLIQSVPVVVNQLSHFVRSPFGALDVPYLLTTNDNFFLYYQLFFHKRLTQRVLVQQPLRGVGLLEFRTDLHNEVFDEAGDLIGLSNYRVRLAQFLRHLGLFDVAGLGWSGVRFFPEKRRQESADFHLQKLITLESQYGFVLALENTLQSDYVSEKVFDALAVGAVPLYLAPPGHGVFRFVPEDAMLNVWAKSFPEVAQEVKNLTEESRLAMVCEGVKAAALAFKDLSLLEHSRRVVVERIMSVIGQELERA